MKVKYFFFVHACMPIYKMENFLRRIVTLIRIPSVLLL